jgi:hypothetical protein
LFFNERGIYPLFVSNIHKNKHDRTGKAGGVLSLLFMIILWQDAHNLVSYT